MLAQGPSLRTPDVGGWLAAEKERQAELCTEDDDLRWVGAALQEESVNRREQLGTSHNTSLGWRCERLGPTQGWWVVVGL